jgi:hypothetical protein
MSQRLLKEIWQKHTEVQEQVLLQRSAPIPIDVNSAQISGDKLIISVDENNRADKVLAQIADVFGLTEKDLELSQGYFYVDSETSTSIDRETKHNLSETAEFNHIRFRPNPIVDGTIINISPIASLNKYSKDNPWEMGDGHKVIICNKYLNKLGLSLWENNWD